MLKCRSFAVMHKSEFFSFCLSVRCVAHFFPELRFSDEEVLEPDFKQKLADMVRIMRPFVHWWVFLSLCGASVSSWIFLKLERSHDDPGRRWGWGWWRWRWEFEW